MVAENIAGMSRDAFATVARRLCDIRATRCDRFATFARCLCDGRACATYARHVATGLRHSRDAFATYVARQSQRCRANVANLSQRVARMSRIIIIIPAMPP